MWAFKCTTAFSPIYSKQGGVKRQSEGTGRRKTGSTRKQQGVQRQSSTLGIQTTWENLKWQQTYWKYNNMLTGTLALTQKPSLSLLYPIQSIFSCSLGREEDCACKCRVEKNTCLNKSIQEEMVFVATWVTWVFYKIITKLSILTLNLLH